MKKNAVVLYDMENVIGGYKKSKPISKYILRDISNKIKKDACGKYNIKEQLSYANWNHDKFKSIQSVKEVCKINLITVTPGQDKYGLDVKLAIDAMSKKNDYNILIIVSGDGDFISLVKELKNSNKEVIGYGYSYQSNLKLKKECNKFINMNNIRIYFSNVIEKFKYQHSTRQSLKNKEEAFKITKEIYDYLSKEKLFTEMGIKNFNKLINHRIKGFDYNKYGVISFSDYIRVTIQNTNLRLISNSSSFLITRKKPQYRKGFKKVPPLKIYSIENYRNLLSKEMKAFFLLDEKVFCEISNFLIEHKNEFNNRLYNDILHDTKEKHPSYKEKDIINSINILKLIGCFNISNGKYSFNCKRSEVLISKLEKKLSIILKNKLNYFKTSDVSPLLSNISAIFHKYKYIKLLESKQHITKNNIMPEREQHITKKDKLPESKPQIRESLWIKIFRLLQIRI